MQLTLSADPAALAAPLRFGPDGLIPAIVQDVASGQVLMLAYMNRESLERTLARGETWFFSRSRQELWHKGDTSGHRQVVKEAWYDCDADALLFKVEQTGVACHEGDFSCFHHLLAQGQDRPGENGTATHSAGTGNVVGLAAEGGPGENRPALEQGRLAGEPPTAGESAGREDPQPQGEAAAISLGATLAEVYRVILERRRAMPEGSYTAYLFRSGLDKILKKVGEEAAETIIAAKNASSAEVRYEMADLYYHTLVLLAWYGLTPADLAGELAARHSR